MSYGFETWILLAADIKKAESLPHDMPMPHSQIHWQDYVRNTEVSSLTGLGPVLDPIVRHLSSLFRRVARLPEDTPVHQALRCHIDLLLGHLPDPSWRRCPGRSRNRWLDLHCRGSDTLLADLTCRHSGDATVLDDYGYLLVMMVKSINETVVKTLLCYKF